MEPPCETGEEAKQMAVEITGNTKLSDKNKQRELEEPHVQKTPVTKRKASATMCSSQGKQKKFQSQASLDTNIMKGFLDKRNPNARSQATKYFDEVKKLTGTWKICTESLLSKDPNYKNEAVQLFCFHILIDYVKVKYRFTGSMEQKTFKNFICKWIKMQSKKTPTEEPAIHTTAAYLICLIFLIDYPIKWPNFFSEIGQAVQYSPSVANIYLRTLLAIHKEICGQETTKTQKEIKEHINETCVDTLVDSWHHILVTYGSEISNLPTLCLQVMSSYMKWININLIATEKLASLFKTLLAQDNLKKAAHDCLDELMRKEMNADAKAKLAAIFSGRTESISKQAVKLEDPTCLQITPLPVIGPESTSGKTKAGSKSKVTVSDKLMEVQTPVVIEASTSSESSSAVTSHTTREKVPSGEDRLEMIVKITAMGYEIDDVELALDLKSNNMEKAVRYLLTSLKVQCNSIETKIIGLVQKLKLEVEVQERATATMKILMPNKSFRASKFNHDVVAAACIHLALRQDHAEIPLKSIYIISGVKRDALCKCITKCHKILGDEKDLVTTYGFVSRICTALEMPFYVTKLACTIAENTVERSITTKEYRLSVFSAAVIMAAQLYGKEQSLEIYLRLRENDINLKKTFKVMLEKACAIIPSGFEKLKLHDIF